MQEPEHQPRPSVLSGTLIGQPSQSPEELIKLLELEMARQRAQRCFRQAGGGGTRAISIALLLVLLAAPCLAMWRLREMRAMRPPAVRPLIALPSGTAPVR